MKALGFPTFATLVVLVLQTLVPLPVTAGPPFIVTPMLTASNAGEGRHLECRVINIGSKPVTVTAELIDETGTVVDTAGACTLSPGAEGCAAFGTCTPVCRAYCRFTGGSKANIRGSIILTPPTTGDALVALPAD